MPKLKSNQVPRYSLHKRSGRAYVTIHGQEIQLGAHDTAESRQAYERTVAEYLANGRRIPDRIERRTTVVELIVKFMEHADRYYTRPKIGADGNPIIGNDGKPVMEPAGELDNYRLAMKPLRRLYGGTAAADFGPKCLKAVAAYTLKPRTIEDKKTKVVREVPGWCRTYANRQMARIKQVFKWGVAEELVPASVYQGLLAVSGLRRGKSDARESEKVRPVAEEDMRAVLPFVCDRLAAMIELQWLAGMRSGEVCRLRTCDLERGPKVWVFRPPAHKTAHHGDVREICFGPQAQKILQPWLKPDLAAFIFSPADAEADRKIELSKNRKTPMTPSQERRRKRTTQNSKSIANRWTSKSYRRAIARACDMAFVPPEALRRTTIRGKTKDRLETNKELMARLTDEQKAQLNRWRQEHRWHPHRLRHSAGTRVRAKYTKEDARAVLGHKHTSMTEVYAERDLEQAARIMGEIG